MLQHREDIRLSGVSCQRNRPGPQGLRILPTGAILSRTAGKGLLFPGEYGMVASLADAQQNKNRLAYEEELHIQRLSVLYMKPLFFL